MARASPGERRANRCRPRAHHGRHRSFAGRRKQLLGFCRAGSFKVNYRPRSGAFLSWSCAGLTRPAALGLRAQLAATWQPLVNELPPWKPHTKGASLMSRANRRTFLKNSLATSAGASIFTIAGTKSTGRVLGANDTIRIAIAGLNGRGGEHVKQFSSMENVHITYLVDPDERAFGTRLPGKPSRAERSSRAPATSRSKSATSARRWTIRTSTPSRSLRPTTGIR